MLRERSRILVISSLLLTTCVSCRSAVRLPRHVAPAGYPVQRSEDLPGAFATIPEADVARALAGRRYRVRWGIFRGFPGPDEPVDALTGRFGFPADGPFESEVDVDVADVHVRTFPQQMVVDGGPVHRMVGCVDLRLSSIPGVTAHGLVVLDVQPVDDAPPMPFAIDAVTGERLPIDAAQLLDENNGPCDRRMVARAAWDDNLRRLHRR